MLLQSVTGIREDINEIKEELHQELPRRYASKWVQHAITFVFSTIGVAIIGALLGLVLIQPTRAVFLYLTGAI